MKKASGFTLIELIIVIVILGILAAYAVPKYMNLDTQARVSVVNGLAGSVRAATAMVHSIAIVQGVTANSSVNIGSGSVTLVNGYPDASNTGINAAISDITGFTYSGTTSSGAFTKNGATNSVTCCVNYTAGTTSNPPTISTNINGC